ncbi:class I SAM-dependent methyltransferase [Cupriavidus sp. CuC1]|uniref:class I SAM-dependent methyltransferase n=1 Tax=Cupriavidus sp. CuC1 TaxID=3373131 RepID=UPI0037D597E1
MTSVSVIDQPWPQLQLETVGACPYCGGTQRERAYEDVQDWAFYCAPGKWTYWNCNDCQALYLDPRPDKQSIGNAYTRYYTHALAPLRRLAEALKNLVRNECYVHWFGMRLSPRLHLPRRAGALTNMLKGKFVIPFGVPELAQMPPGSLLDIGCGSGGFLLLAKQAGWQTLGIDLDSKACEAAQSKGLRVVNASIEDVAKLDEKFDCLFCSHILEHTYDPNGALCSMRSVLKPGGTLLLSLPNSQSTFRKFFGKDWRGLEAPRHIAIPSAESLKAQLEQLGFHVSAVLQPTTFNSAESFRIRRRSDVLLEEDIQKAHELSTQLSPMDYREADFVNFVCKLPLLPRAGE